MSSELAIENLILISTCEKLIWSACFTKDGPTVGPPSFFGNGLHFFIFFPAAHSTAEVAITAHLTAEVTILPATICLLMRFSFSLAVGHCGPMGSN